MAPPPQLDVVPLYPQEAAAPKTTVMVTGVTGFLAGSIVERLLATGHTVHGTCRKPQDESTVAHLKRMPGADDRLKLFQADLTSGPGAFEPAMAGCQYVLHVASPYVNNVPVAQVREKLLDPAVKGTEAVLTAVDNTPSVKRVVLTSSCAAIYGNPHEHGKDHVYTEADWNPTANERCLAYYYSKKLAEEKAWELAKKQSRWDLVVINPAVILGPPLAGRSDSESVGVIKNIMAGQLYPAAPYMGFGAIDVRDVAAAHTLAMVHPRAQGRYICVAKSILVKDICKALATAFPKAVRVPFLTVPKTLLWLLGTATGMSRDMVTHAVGYCPQFDNSKIQKELGFKFHDLDAAIKDQAEAMAALGIIKPLPA